MNAKTQARIDRLAQAVRDQYPELAGKDIGQMRAVAEQVIREQDLDTRHACAEAVNSLVTTPGFMPHTDAEVVVEVIQRAHAACMNTQAV